MVLRENFFDVQVVVGRGWGGGTEVVNVISNKSAFFFKKEVTSFLSVLQVRHVWYIIYNVHTYKYTIYHTPPRSPSRPLSTDVSVVLFYLFTYNLLTYDSLLKNLNE